MESKNPNNQSPHPLVPTYICRVAVLSCDEKEELKERISNTIGNMENG